MPFSQGSKATVPTFTRLGNVRLHCITGTPKPSLTTCRRGQQPQLAREKAPLLEREEESKCTEINVKTEARGNVDIELPRFSKTSGETNAWMCSWVCLDAQQCTLASILRKQCQLFSRPQYSLISLACQLSYSMTPEGRSECRVCRDRGLSINLQRGNVTTERTEVILF